MKEWTAREWIVGTLVLVFITICGANAVIWGVYSYKLFDGWDEIPDWRIKWMATFIGLLAFSLPIATGLFVFANLPQNENEKESGP